MKVIIDKQNLLYEEKLMINLIDDIKLCVRKHFKLMKSNKNINSSEIYSVIINALVNTIGSVANVLCEEFDHKKDVVIFTDTIRQHISFIMTDIKNNFTEKKENV